jgi:hypothetical protein
MRTLRNAAIVFAALLVLWVVLGLLLRLMALLFIAVALLLVGALVVTAISAALRR